MFPLRRRFHPLVFYHLLDVKMQLDYFYTTKCKEMWATVIERAIKDWAQAPELPGISYQDGEWIAPNVTAIRQSVYRRYLKNEPYLNRFIFRESDGFDTLYGIVQLCDFDEQLIDIMRAKARKDRPKHIALCHLLISLTGGYEPDTDCIPGRAPAGEQVELFFDRQATDEREIDWAIALVTDYGLPPSAIAESLGVSYQKVNKWVEKWKSERTL